MATSEQAVASRLGSFDHFLIGPYRVVPEDQLDSVTYWGCLRHTDVVAGLWLRGDDGTYFTVTNGLKSAPDGGSVDAMPWGGGTRSVPGTTTEPDPDYTAWVGKAIQELTPANQVKWTIPDVGDELVFDDEIGSWTSADRAIGLSGRIVSPVGVQFLFPWRTPEGDTGIMYYLVQVYAVDGTYHGSSVKGFMSIENQWGTESYRDMWWPRNRSGHWSFFATEYDDGEMEMGYLLCFEEGARGVSFVNDRGQEVFGATSVHVAPEVDADGNATRIRYTADDHPGAWEWIREPDGVRGGWVQRVGETRGVVRWVGANGFYGRGARVPPTPQP